jgi:hypothetical protein
MVMIHLYFMAVRPTTTKRTIKLTVSNVIEETGKCVLLISCGCSQTFNDGKGVV